MHKMIEDVLAFHRAFGHPILGCPHFPASERIKLREKLLVEEFCEQAEKDFEGNLYLAPIGGMPEVERLADIADWLADMIYYLIGTAHEYGIPLAKVWDEVQRANMEKLWTYDEVRAYIDNHPIPVKVEGVEIKTPSGVRVSLLPGSRDQVEKQTKGQYNEPHPGCPLRCYQVKRADGKVEKPPSWQPPDIIKIILEARADHEVPT